MKSLPTILQFELIFSLSLIGLYVVAGQNDTTLGQNVTTVTNSSIEEVNITMNNESVTYPSMNESKSKPEADRVTNHRNQYQLSQVPFDSRYDYCSCDLKAGFCDLNCCCDEDCNDEERVMFAYCESVKHSKQMDQYCFKEYPVYQNNTRRSILVKESSSSLFCVFNDNVKNIKTYPDRKSVTNVQEYRKIITSSSSALTSTFSWSHSHEEEDDVFTSTHGKGFRYGDPIVATSITSRGVEINDIFRLPASLLVSQGFCDTLRPILFLKDSSHSCVRDIKDYQQECISNQFLGASIYYENIYISKMGSSKPMEPETRTYYQIEYTSSEKQSVKLPTTAKTSISTNKQNQTADARNVQSKMATLSIPNCMYLNECIAIHWSDKDSNFNATRLVQNTKTQTKICEGVVNIVNYTFYYDPKDGIDLIRLSFGFTELTENLPIKQTFNVNFKPNENYLANKTFPSHEFSGNKGYIFGKPILFRNSSLSNNSSSEVNHYKIPSLSQGNGQCTVNPMIQQTVRFGSNYRTGCMLNTSRFLVENKMCQSIQREIMDLLDGVNKDLTYVAMFGNPNISNPSDWIPILVDDEPQILQSDSVPRLTADERCPALVTGFSLDIYYALVGQESQSQAKIISAVKRFNKPVDFRLRCHSLLCRHKNNNFLIELSLTVNYIDLTFPIETKFAPPPIFRFQLPSDFFYPFLTNSFHNYNDRKIFISCVFISLIIHYLSNQHI